MTFMHRGGEPRQDAGVESGVLAEMRHPERHVPGLILRREAADSRRNRIGRVPFQKP